MPVQAPSAGRNEDRTTGLFSDSAGGARRERDRDHLAALAGDDQRPVPAVHAQVLDIGAVSFGDPQPIQREQRDQRVLADTCALATAPAAVAERDTRIGPT
jgi:hypothetical protein